MTARLSRLKLARFIHKAKINTGDALQANSEVESKEACLVPEVTVGIALKPCVFAVLKLCFFIM